MSTKFFNNNPGNSLFDKLKGIATDMAHFDRFLAVVGFFRSSGYFKLRRELGDVSDIRILVGINIDNLYHYHNQAMLDLSREECAEVREQYLRQMQQDIAEADYSDEVEEGILQMASDLADRRLQIRIHAQRNLHAKFYLCLPKKYTPNSDGTVIMGSSNISDSGLGFGTPPRYELNVALRDYDDVQFCLYEFERLWIESDELKAADFAASLQPTHIAQLPTPYEIYIKVLIDAFGSIIEDGFTPHIPEGYMKLKYQNDAAIQGFQMMKRYNGFFLADVVGTGKTIVAALIAARFVEENGSMTRILVVHPPAVATNWNDTFSDFGLKEYTHFVTNGSLSHILEPRDNFLPRDAYDLIIVDEAHNFCSQNADRFDELQQLCKSPRRHKGGIGGRKRVMLVSATPLKNGPEDLRNLIKLFQDENNLTIDGVGNNLNVLFNPWVKRYRELMGNRKDGNKNVTGDVDRLYGEIRNVLLEKLMLRRTRHNLERHYGSDLEQQHIKFPKLKAPAEHGYELDPPTAELFALTTDLLTEDPVKKPAKPGTREGRLHYARYRAIEFLKPDKQSRFEHAEHTSRTLAAIYRTMMVKRLESSFEAFRKSLATLLRITEQMIAMFDQDKVIIAPEAHIKDLMDRGLDVDGVIDWLDKRDYSADDYLYHKDDFQDGFYDMLTHDRDTLRRFCGYWNEIKEDPKLDKFFSLIDTELFDKRFNPGGKLVVFSESLDTVNYLERKLKEHYHRNDILAISAANRNREKERIRRNFDANYKGTFENEFNIILSTDVLAEGINLHRANVIVNYDTPWNATKLMQRVGRVNRIGSPAGQIHSHMFYPSAEGDKQISLVSNALIKLQGFHSALGEDERVFSHDEMLRHFELFDADNDDDIDRRLQLQRELSDLYHNNRRLYEHIRLLPCKSRTVRRPDNPSRRGSSVVHIKNGEKSQFYLVVGDGTPKAIEFLDAIELLRAEPDERPATLGEVRDLHFSHVQKALQCYRAALVALQDDTLTASHKSDPNTQKAMAFVRDLKRAFADDSEMLRMVKSIEAEVQMGRIAQLTLAVVRQSRAVNKQLKDVKNRIVDLRPQLRSVIADWCDTYRVGEAASEQAGRSYNNPQIITSETFLLS